MGTSISGGGPGDKIFLLPSWAMPGGLPTPAGGDSGSNEGEGEGAADGEQNSAGATTPSPAPAKNGNHWNSAKRRLGSTVTNRDGRPGIARAGGAYVRALGGSKSASRSASSARAATSRLGGFLSSVTHQGMTAALQSLGLGRYVGKDSNVVFAAIVDALAPEGTNLEEAAARAAIEETLAGIFEEYVVSDGSLTALESMTPEAIRAALEASVAASIFNRWLGDLAKKLEEKAVTPSDAVKLERDMVLYIKDTVKLDLEGKDPLRIDWAGAEGTQLTGRIYDEAYSIIGGERR